jgi:putative ABC transport system substrate-binding protein
MFLRAFRQGLSEAGFGNAAIEHRLAQGSRDRPPVLTADLVRRQVSVIVTSGAPPHAPPRPRPR